MSGRTSASLLALALGLAPVASAQVASAPLAEVDPWGVGWLGKNDGALPSSLWANTTTLTLAPLYAAIQPQQLSPAGRAVLRRVVLSSAKGPADAKGASDPSPLTPERLRLIEQLGETEHALDLRKRFPDTAWGKSFDRMTADHELLLGQSKAACARAADKRGDDAAWMPVRAFCFALARDFEAASLAAEHIPAPEGKPADPWLLSALAYMEAPAKAKPEGRYATALDTAISIAAKLPAGANAFAATPGDIAAAVIAHPDATPEQKRAALRPALNAGQIKAAAVLDVLHAETAATARPAQAAAAGRAAPRADFLAMALASAAAKDAKTDARATAYAAALKSAESLSDFRLAATALVEPIKALPKSAETLPNAETFARVAILAGDPKAAQDWRKLMDTAPKDKADPWAAARIDLLLSYSGASGDKPGAILDRLIAAVPPPAEVAAKAATPQSRQLDVRRIENTRFLFLHAGMGRDLSPAQRTLLAAQKPAGRGVSDAALARITAAIDQDADGEAALAAIALLGNDVSALSFAGLADLLVQFRRAGLEDNANAIALESLQAWKAM